MGASSLPPNILAWSPADVAAWLDAIGLPGLRAVALEKSVTGPQLLSMTPEEISDQLGATVLQSRKIHSEINKISSGEGSQHLTDVEAPPAPAPTFSPASQGPMGAAVYASMTPAEAEAYNTAATTASLPDHSAVDTYGSGGGQHSLYETGAAGAVAAGATAGAAATAAYFGTLGKADPSGGARFYPGTEGSEGAGAGATAVDVPAVAGGPPAAAFAAAPPPHAVAAPAAAASHLPLCRALFWPWLFFLVALLGVSGVDLAFSIIMNSKLTDGTDGWAFYRSVYQARYLDGEAFWCALFFAAQGFTIISTLILLPLYVIKGRSGSLNFSKNLAFATGLVALVGLTIYALPISKWTYVILSDYSMNLAFGPSAPSALPEIAFALEWTAVGLWLAALILAVVHLAILTRSRRKR